METEYTQQRMEELCMAEIERQPTVINVRKVTSPWGIRNEDRHWVRILNGNIQCGISTTTAWQEGQRWAHQINPEAGIILPTCKKDNGKGLSTLPGTFWGQRQKYSCKNGIYICVAHGCKPWDCTLPQGETPTELLSEDLIWSYASCRTQI